MGDPNAPLTPDEIKAWQAVQMQLGHGPHAYVAPAVPPPSVAPVTPPVAEISDAPPTAAEFAKYAVSPTQAAIAERGPRGPALADRPWAEQQAFRDASRAAVSDPAAQRANFPNGPAPDPAPVPTGAGIKFATPGAPGSGGVGAPAESDINWRGATGGTQTIAAHEVPLVTQKRQDALTGAIDSEAKAIEGQAAAAGGSAEAAAEVERQRAIGTRDIAKATEDAGIDTKLRAQTAADDSKAYRAHIDDFAKKLSEDKIDANRMYANAGTGSNILWTLAKAFGAVQQGFLHLPSNQIADAIEARAAQDVAEQRANHEIGRENLADMKSGYAMALQSAGTAEEAERVATGYALTAAKHNAEALTQNATSEVQKKRGAEIAAALDERIAQLGEKKVEKGIAMNPLQQARTVGGGDDRAKIGAAANDYLMKQAAMGNTVTPDEAIQYAIKMHTLQNPLPGQPFAGGAKHEKGDKKDVQASIDEVNKQYDDLLKHPVIDKLGFMPAVADAGGFQRLMPGSSAILPQVTKMGIEMDSYAGKLLKDNEGRIPPPIVEQLHKFHPKPGDTPEFARAQIEASRQYVNSLARAGGQKAPEPNVGAPPGFQK